MTQERAQWSLHSLHQEAQVAGEGRSPGPGFLWQEVPSLTCKGESCSSSHWGGRGTQRVKSTLWNQTTRVWTPHAKHVNWDPGLAFPGIIGLTSHVYCSTAGAQQPWSGTDTARGWVSCPKQAFAVLFF